MDILFGVVQIRYLFRKRDASACKDEADASTSERPGGNWRTAIAAFFIIFMNMRTFLLFCLIIPSLVGYSQHPYFDSIQRKKINEVVFNTREYKAFRNLTKQKNITELETTVTIGDDTILYRLFYQYLNKNDSGRKLFYELYYSTIDKRIVRVVKTKNNPKISN